MGCHALGNYTSRFLKIGLWGCWGKMIAKDKFVLSLFINDEYTYDQEEVKTYIQGQNYVLEQHESVPVY